MGTGSGAHPVAGKVVGVQAVVAGAGQNLAAVAGPAQRPDAEVVIAVGVRVVRVLRQG